MTPAEELGLCTISILALACIYEVIKFIEYMGDCWSDHEQDK